MRSPLALSLGASDGRVSIDRSLAEWFERVSPDGPVAVLGVLREDAAPAASGVALSIDVSSVARVGADADITVRGGVRLSIGGALLGDRISEWRAGRSVRMPALLRQPSAYFNPGTPDERPGLARRGIALVGTVKSGAVVEVVQRGSRVE